MLRPRRRPGFTTIEVVIVMAILAVLAAVIAVPVARNARRSTGAALASSLPSLASAVTAFRGDVGRYPGSLVYLSRPIVAGDADLCGVAIPTGLLARWDGPYVGRAVSAAGIPAGRATVLTGLLRQPAAGPGYGELVLRAIDVERHSADELEVAFDGPVTAGSYTSGTIRWIDAPGNAPDTLSYRVPVDGC